MTEASRGAADPWSTLGLPGTASVAEAERAYRRLAKHHHPDAVGGPVEAQAWAAERMRELNEAIAAVRDGAAGPGWWHGTAPGADTDWFGFPLRDEPVGAREASAPRQAPLRCPACGAVVSGSAELRHHLGAEHGVERRRHRRRPSPLDRLDTLAWRTPVEFLAVLAGMAGLVALLWLRDVLPADADLRALVGSTDQPLQLGHVLLWFAAPAIAVGLVLELLVSRHRGRVERAGRAAARRRRSPGAT